MIEAPDAGHVGVQAPPPSDVPAPAPDPAPGKPRRLRSLIIGVIIAGALAAFLFLGLGSSSGSGPVVGVGSAAPTFSVASLIGGTPVDLNALGPDRHRPVVLNFFASWCGPCQEETPLLANMAKAERAKGSTVQFVGVDVADKPVDALPFVSKSGVIYPVGVDADFKVSSGLYGVNGMPSTFFIDATGRVIGQHFGPLNQTQLDQYLHQLAGAKG